MPPSLRLSRGSLPVAAHLLVSSCFGAIHTAAEVLLDEEGDLLDFDLQEVRVSKSIIRHARTVFLVTDHSKFDRSAPVRIASISELDALYTDRQLPASLAIKSRDWDTDIIVT